MGGKLVRVRRIENLIPLDCVVGNALVVCLVYIALHVFLHGIAAASLRAALRRSRLAALAELEERRERRTAGRHAVRQRRRRHVRRVRVLAQGLDGLWPGARLRARTLRD